MSILQTVTTEKVMEPPRIVVYGSPKVGKSTFVASSYQPIMADIENGSKNIKVPRVSDIDTFEKFKSLCTELLNEEHNYKTFVIDSADWLEKLVQAEVCLQHKASGIEAIGYGKGYQYSVELFAKVLAVLDMLREKKKMAIVFVCHDQVKKYDDPINESYDRHTLKLHNKVEALLTEWADAILYATKKVYTIQKDSGFGGKETKATGGSERVLICSDTPSALAGNRYSLPKELPMDWATLQQEITKGLE